MNAKIETANYYLTLARDLTVRNKNREAVRAYDEAERHLPTELLNATRQWRLQCQAERLAVLQIIAKC